MLGLPLIAALCLSPSAPVPKPAVPAGPFYYPTKVGARWVWVVADTGKVAHALAVSTAEERGGVFVLTVGKEGGADVVVFTKLRVSAAGVAWIGNGRTDFAGPSDLLRLPPRAGETWEHAVDGDPLKRMTRTTVAEEAVTVPAGTFRAVRVRGVTEVEGRKQEEEFWYAPGVGPVRCDVRVNGKAAVSLELKSFDPGK